ncbi:MAG: hypothetical protein OES38_06640 [Gammaproteobacteria bacterium]|nr:hypothetical protein [Gammaproteobacteria bacterium]
MATDLIFLESDRHRVVLLARLLNGLGANVGLGTEPSMPRSDTVLVVCTSAAINEPWLTSLFTDYPNAVALLLDGVELPRPCTRAVDLTSWPARSADAAVRSLARWLKKPEMDRAFGVPAARRFKKGSKSGSRKKRDGPGPWVTASLLFGLIAGFGLLLWSTVPGDDEVDQSTTADTASDRRVEIGIGAESGDKLGDSVASSVAAGGGTAAGDGSGQDTPETALDSDLFETAPGRQVGGNDALSRLCRAADPASASAWLGALNWKQRARLDAAPCVRQLAARPGFESFAELLEQQAG